MSPTEVIKRLTDELNAATAHREQLKADLADKTERLSAALSVAREKLYAPLWMIPRSHGGPVPNTLWLITSLALIAAGAWVMR